jgi:sentrin-specific protease 1
LDFLIIPIHAGGNHWAVSIINFKKKRFEYRDSLLGNYPNPIPILRKYILEEHFDKKNTKYDLSNWKNYSPENSRQLNGYDCGVFACCYLNFGSLGKKFKFDQSHMEYMRKRIACEIINVSLMNKFCL